MASQPWLLYAYPWMPFPRRVIIYLREKNIPSSLVTIVPVSDPQLGDTAAEGFPPRPIGSLPILAIPDSDSADSKSEPYIYIRQSLAIMNYLDELCDAGAQGFPKSAYSMRGEDALNRARVTELMCLADELTIAWNPVRIFGTGAGNMTLPEASKEMLRWLQRTLTTIERWFEDKNFSDLRAGGTRGPNMAEIVLYQFLEFTKDCFAKDMTKGSVNKGLDVYGREQASDEFPKLAEFYEAFRTRESAVRKESAGEVAGEKTLKAMQTWNW
jgi:glutathione S-transferase